MTDKLNEDAIEQFAIELLTAEGYHYSYGTELTPDAANPQRASFGDVLLLGRLREAVARINPNIPADAREQAIKAVQNAHAPELLAANEAFHRLLTDGVEVEYQREGATRGDKVWLVDFENPTANDCLVVNQFTIIENQANKRPDLILFINGLLVASDGLEARMGSLSAGFSRFMAWKTADGKSDASHLVSQLETLIKGVLEPATLLELIRHFTVFEKESQEDAKTGLTTVSTVKKVGGYHQFYAVEKAVESTLRATSSEGGRKGGVVWHTQGSGKSLSMVFYTGKLVLALDNPTIVVLTDRNDLDDQLFDTFAASRQLLRQEPVQAEGRDDLRDKLKVASGGIIFTTMQKFSPKDGETIYPLLSDRRNIVVIADEAHRSQYGFKAREVDIKDGAGNIIGKKTAYGFAKYLRDALPNATFIGFTGTPVELDDKNTPAVFGDYVDVYDIAQAVEDGATVRIYYESRLAKVRLKEEEKEELDQRFDKVMEDASDYETGFGDEDDDQGWSSVAGDRMSGATELSEKAKAKWTRLEAIVGNR